jgi:GTPase
VNKVDLLEKKAEMLPFLQKVSGQRNFDAIVPLSAQAIKNLDALKEAVSALLPEQPFFYDEDTLTDRPEKFLAAERIREKLFRLVGDELPYTCTVVIDKFEIEEGRRVIYASILVDRSSHKAMIIGKGGEKLKRIGSEARQDMERLFGGSVHLETWVKVRSGWADNASLLQSLGYE